MVDSADLDVDYIIVWCVQKHRLDSKLTAFGV